MTDSGTTLVLALDPLTRHFLDELCQGRGEDQSQVIAGAVATYHASFVAGEQEDANQAAARVAAETARDAVEEATEDAAGAP